MPSTGPSARFFRWPSSPRAGRFVPLALYRLHGPRLAPLAINLAVSALLLILAGAATSSPRSTRPRAWTSPAGPGAAALHFLRLGLSSAIVWLPVLLLTGLGLGQRSEARLAKLREAREAAR
jgi:hypothetical protein